MIVFAGAVALATLAVMGLAVVLFCRARDRSFHAHVDRHHQRHQARCPWPTDGGTENAS